MKHICAAALVAAAGLCAPASAATTVYTSAAAFAAASTGVTNVNFEGSPTGMGTYILGSGTYSSGGVTLSQTTKNAFLSDPTGPSVYYYYDWGTGDVINTPYLETLTVTFSSAVTAFGIDLGSFFGLPIPPGVLPGAATTGYGADVIIGTAQGNFLVDLASTRNFTFFGVTSTTAFTSFTITGATTQAGASTVFDNIKYGSAIAPVPEPASWALMIGGLGLVGAAMRRRRATVRFA